MTISGSGLTRSVHCGGTDHTVAPSSCSKRRSPYRLYRLPTQGSCRPNNGWNGCVTRTNCSGASEESAFSVEVQVAARGTLHLAADPRRSGAFERDPADDAARWTRLDPGLAKICEATGCRRMRPEDFTAAYGERMYLLFMAIRPEALPTDAAALTEMVLALDAENEKLRVAMQTLKEMIFGKRSERLAALVAEQLALELDDLETGVISPAPANDDAVATKPAGKPRKKASRNIGALPKHLPRCEQVLEPDATACPCCEGRLHKIGEDVSEVLDVIPAILRVLRTIRPKYACRGCTDGVVQAKVLPRLIESGMAAPPLGVDVGVS